MKKVGRPSDYPGAKACALLEKVTNEMTPQNFKQHCSIYHIALLFGKHVDTIYEWRKKHEEFSEAIKKWETKRNALAFEISGWSDARWIFCMKNWTGMSDKQELEHSGEVSLPVFILPRPGKKP